MDLPSNARRLRRFVTEPARTIASAAARCARNRGIESAAGIAFFTVFSLFPLLILLITIGSFFLEDVDIQKRIFDTAFSLLPESAHELIRRNVKQIINSRGAMSIVGVGGLLWAASGVLVILTRTIARAWPETHRRNVLKARLNAVLMLGILGVLLAAFFVVQMVLRFLADTPLPFRLGYVLGVLISAVSPFLVYGFTFTVLTLMYRFVPNSFVRWRDAAAGGVFTLVLSEAFTWGFGKFLDSGLARYNLVYGSLGTLVAFMFWTYAVCVVLVMGAYVSSETSRRYGGDTTEDRSGDG